MESIFFDYGFSSKDLMDTSLLKTDNLKSIEIDEDKHISSKEMHFGINYDDEKYDSWYLIDDEPYYFKNRSSNIVILNELLGEELSIYMKLPTIHYNIASKGGNIVGVVSKNFLDGTYEHIPSMYASKQIYSKVKKMITDANYPCDEEVRSQMTSLIVRNFYASLMDRNVNSYIGLKNNDIIISPLFDYEASFIDREMYFYVDPLFGYCFDFESIEYIKKNNNYFQEYLNLIYEYNIIISLSNIEDKHGIHIPNSFAEFYIGYDKERKEYIKKLGL